MNIVNLSNLNEFDTANDNAVIPIVSNNGSYYCGNLPISEFSNIFNNSPVYMPFNKTIKIIKAKDTAVTIQFYTINSSSSTIIITTKNGQMQYSASNKTFTIGGDDEFYVTLLDEGLYQFNITGGEVTYIDFTNAPELDAFRCDRATIKTDTLSFLSCPRISLIDFTRANADTTLVKKIITPNRIYTNISNQKIVL